MQVKYSIHEKYTSPEVVICNHEMNDEVRAVGELISKTLNSELNGYTEKGASVLRQADLIRIYAENQKVYAQTQDGKYAIHSTLYELEAQLEEGMFLRISKSEIVNRKKILRLDTSMAGTVRIFLQGDIETFVSRRNVPMIRKVLLGGAKS